MQDPSISAEDNMEIEKIYTYPVKALRPVELDSVQVTKHGFPHDRRFMILRVSRQDDKHVDYANVHIADTPESVFFHPTLDLVGEMVTITYKPAGKNGKETSIDFPLHPYTGDLDVINVEMHKSPTKAYKMSQRYATWFSDCYGFEAVLAYLGPHYRPVLMSSEHGKPAPSPISETEYNYTGWVSSISSMAKGATSLITGSGTKYDAEVTFADVAPYLVVSCRSMDNLHTRLPEGEKMDILKFRPNIVVSGADQPWDEDFWGEITIGSEAGAQTKIGCVHNCGRCKSINIDYETGRPGKGPQGQMLKQMQRDRRVDLGAKYSPIFGRYSFLHPGSEGNTIRVGDKVYVSRKLSERTRFGQSPPPSPSPMTIFSQAAVDGRMLISRLQIGQASTHSHQTSPFI